MSAAAMSTPRLTTDQNVLFSGLPWEITVKRQGR